MTYIDKRKKALELLKLGKSYSQIKSELGVSKSILSAWLKKYPLSKEKIHLLRDINETRIEKFRQTMKLKRETKLLNAYKEQKENIIPKIERELLLAGILLYWGEGSKTERGLISVSNTDPAVLKFTLLWIVKGLGVPKEKVRALLHIYDDMNIEEVMTFWSKTLGLPLNQFSKPYVKKSNRTDLDEKGYGYGTCNLRISSVEIKDNVMMAIKAIGDYSAKEILSL
jgi:transcriptional regulator with XRE-family HTH domain